jgi:hypothetical protein
VLRCLLNFNTSNQTGPKLIDQDTSGRQDAPNARARRKAVVDQIAMSALPDARRLCRLIDGSAHAHCKRKLAEQRMHIAEFVRAF